ncbi:Outer membrane autotransporter barrel protein [Mycoplasmopsis canis PG 14]|uniref:hypothetical protein n=1 Tax=Mycoplasmopsis canis TaxID=29555 RepID=UPI00025AE865|nr:hypothetical protein [Mycoplasmopsis canis]EIE40570.1 Outer membrane autotransporter barrel protein [Mycoplasmopsis canis PG 14]
MKIYKKIFLSLPIAMAPIGIVACAKPEQPSQPSTQPAQPRTQPSDKPAQPSQPSQPAQPSDQPAQPTQPSQPAKPSDQPAQPSQPSQPAKPSNQPSQPAQPSTQPAQPSDQPVEPSGENNQSTNETKEIIELPEPRGDKERTKNSRKSKIGFSGIALLGENQVDLANNNDELAVKFRYSVIFKDDESNPVTIETGNIPNNAGLKLIVKKNNDGNLVFSPSEDPNLRPTLFTS